MDSDRSGSAWSYAHRRVGYIENTKKNSNRAGELRVNSSNILFFRRHIDRIMVFLRTFHVVMPWTEQTSAGVSGTC